VIMVKSDVVSEVNMTQNGVYYVNGSTTIEKLNIFAPTMIFYFYFGFQNQIVTFGQLNIEDCYDYSSGFQGVVLDVSLPQSIYFQASGSYPIVIASDKCSNFFTNQIVANYTYCDTSKISAPNQQDPTSPLVTQFVNGSSYLYKVSIEFMASSCAPEPPSTVNLSSYIYVFVIIGAVVVLAIVTAAVIFCSPLKYKIFANEKIRKDIKKKDIYYGFKRCY